MSTLKPLALIAAFCWAVGAAGQAWAAESSPCAGTRLSEAATLAALPAPVAALLRGEGKGPAGIADRNAEFNRTDDADGNLPMRRFAGAGVSADCALVAVERGGRGYRGYWVELRTFARTAAVWREVRRQSIPSIPASAQAFEAYAHQAAPDAREPALLASLGQELRQLRALPMRAETHARCPEEKLALIGLTGQAVLKAMGPPDGGVTRQNRYRGAWNPTPSEVAGVSLFYLFRSPQSKRYEEMSQGGGHPELTLAFDERGKVASVDCSYAR